MTSRLAQVFQWTTLELFAAVEFVAVVVVAFDYCAEYDPAVSKTSAVGGGVYTFFRKLYRGLVLLVTVLRMPSDLVL